jgi:hypothetical protein
MNRIHDMRGGKENVAEFGARMRGEGVWADLIRQRFEKALARMQLGKRSEYFFALDASGFKPPQPDRQSAAHGAQLNLF